MRLIEEEVKRKLNANLLRKNRLIHINWEYYGGYKSITGIIHCVRHDSFQIRTEIYNYLVTFRNKKFIIKGGHLDKKAKIQSFKLSSCDFTEKFQVFFDEDDRGWDICRLCER